MSEGELNRSIGNQISALVICIAVCFAAAALGGLATSSGLQSWYATLQKPTWNPPHWVFGPVWSCLYLMMGVSVWLVWRAAGLHQGKVAIGWFVGQLILNSLWSIIFFGMRQPGWAVIEIVALWISIALCIGLFAQHSRIAAALLVPYLIWVSFASYLNYTIWSMN